MDDLTPEQLVEDAFSLFAPDGSDWEQYKRRRADLLSLIRSYGEAQAAVQKERDAMIADAAIIDATGSYQDNALYRLAAKRIAAAIRAETPPPTPEGA